MDRCNRKLNKYQTMLETHINKRKAEKTVGYENQNKENEENKIADQVKAYKENYLKTRTQKEMLFENGTAIGILYQEIQKLNGKLKTVIDYVYKENIGSINEK